MYELYKHLEIMRLTKKEMVAWRRKALGLDAADAGCVVERTDGVDLDEVLATGLRLEYLRMLDEGDESMIEPVDVALMDGLKRDGSSNGLESLLLPPGVRRVLSVRLRGWAQPVRPLKGAEASEVLRAQDNPYTCATENSPVALITADGRLMAGPLPPIYGEDTGVQSLLCAYDFGEDTYVLDERGLRVLAMLNA